MKNFFPIYFCIPEIKSNLNQNLRFPQRKWKIKIKGIQVNLIKMLFLLQSLKCWKCTKNEEEIINKHYPR